MSPQETTDDHPHLDAVIAALGRVQINGMRVCETWATLIKSQPHTLPLFSLH